MLRLGEKVPITQILNLSKIERLQLFHRTTQVDKSFISNSTGTL